jgi:hypothetical protein
MGFGGVSGSSELDSDTSTSSFGSYGDRSAVEKEEGIDSVSQLVAEVKLIRQQLHDLSQVVISHQGTQHQTGQPQKHKG